MRDARVMLQSEIRSMVRSARCTGTIPAVICCLALSFAGCGGTSGVGAATVSGTLAGTNYSALSFSEVTAVVVHNDLCTVDHVESAWSAIELLLSVRAGLCQSEVAQVQPADNTLIILDLEETSAQSSAALPLGSYTITAAGQTSGIDASGNAYTATATAETLDATCALSGGASATSGSVTISAIDGNDLTGSFTLSFSGGTLAGTFATAPCALTDEQFCAAKLPRQLTCAN